MPERDPSVCVNCGQPAVYRTLIAAANVDYYCEICGSKAYPGKTLLVALDDAPPQQGTVATALGQEDSGPMDQENSGPADQQDDSSHVMRGGLEVEDPRLGRVPQFDERSRSFPMTEILAETTTKEYKPRSYTWECKPHFNQGSEGSCVGHAWAHEMVCRPVVIEGIDQPFARWVYKTAQKYDYWSGEAYEGTSVIAGAKVCQSRPPKMAEGRGLMLEYRWIFGNMDELIKTIGYFGPVVLGCNWYADMMKTGTDGFIKRTGSYMGGHAILIKGQSLAKKAFRLHNSWGTTWGEGGDAWISFADLEKLLGEQGELCVPVHRKEWG